MAKGGEEKWIMAYKLVLASASPRRKQLLEDSGISFEVRPADIDEIPRSGEQPRSFATRTAREKCQFCLDSLQDGDDSVVLAADTIVVVDEMILGKPTDHEDAKKMLQALSGKEHQVITAYCLAVPSIALKIERSVATRVKFRDLDRETIADYVATGEPLDKAGAYAIQGAGAALVTGIEGSYTNVVGLPLAEVVVDLEKVKAAKLFNFGENVHS
jgi:nucleoside triphosphate pyrophosphatase